MSANVLNNIDELEERIRFSLSPVPPNPEFVHKLKTRLDFNPAVKLEQHSRQPAVFLLLAGGLFFGALLAWLFYRFRSA